MNNTIYIQYILTDSNKQCQDQTKFKAVYEIIVFFGCSKNYFKFDIHCCRYATGGIIFVVTSEKREAILKSNARK